jgi:hypothetical protein
MEEQGQLNIFNNPNCDLVRARNSTPAPDADGLFDFLGVSAIAGRRECTVKRLSDLALDVVGSWRGQSTEVRTQTLTATTPGLWDPVSIIAACTRARGLKVFEVDRATAKPKNEGLLDEIKIARICGADGLRPYLSKASRYMRNEQRQNNIMLPPNRAMQEMGREGWQAEVDPGMRHAGEGEPTWAFKQVLFSEIFDHNGRSKHFNSYAWRKAVRTLQDVWLLDVTPGPRGGLVRAVCRWTPRAYLPEIPVMPEALHADDEHALDCLAEGAPIY